MASEAAAGDQRVVRPNQASGLHVSSRAASRVAYLSAAANLAAALAMLFVLQPGLPSTDSGPDGRLAFITAHVGFWWGGWLLWHAAAIGLVALYVALAGCWWRLAPIRCTVALLCGAAGLAADLAAEALYMGLAPALRPHELAALEPVVALLTGYAGNGLYTVAGALLTWAGASRLPRPLVLLSLPVWGAGAALSAGTLARSVEVQFWSTAVLMPGFVLWSALLGRWLAHRAS